MPSYLAFFNFKGMRFHFVLNVHSWRMAKDVCERHIGAFASISFAKLRPGGFIVTTGRAICQCGNYGRCVIENVKI